MNKVFKISQLGGDTSLYLSNVQSLKHVFLKLDKFWLCSGLKINRENTEVFPINCNIGSDKSIEVVWKQEKIKSLGVWFTPIEGEMSALNLDEKLVKLKKGRVLVSKKCINKW